MSKQDNPNVVGNIAIVFMSILLIAVGCIMLFTDAVRMIFCSPLFGSSTFGSMSYPTSSLLVQPAKPAAASAAIAKKIIFFIVVFSADD